MSWLFTLAWFSILDSAERNGFESKRRLWLLPLLMLVWVNVHGGFLVGFVLLGIFWLGAVWEWFRAKKGRIEELLHKVSAAKRVRRLVWVGLLSGAASLVNPYGWKLHAHVFSYLSSRFLMNHIDEFQSPNFHGVPQRCFLVLLLITLAALALRGRGLRMSHGLTVLFAVYTALYSSRNIPVSSVLLVLVVGSLIARATEPISAGDSLRLRSGPAQATVGLGFFPRMTAVESRLRGHLWPILAVIVTLGIVWNGGRIQSTVLMDAHFDTRRMPVKAINYLVNHELKGPVLSPDYWGGYLIYRFYPGMQVVVDDRHDLYGEEFLKSYLKMVHVEPGWQDFLRDHASGCVLLPRQAALTSVLIESGSWKVIYRDEVAVAFVAR
jgi:hypothetical protein